MTVAAPTDWLQELILNLAGETFGEYVIDGFLSKGAFGLVFDCHHAASNQPAALKLLNPTRFNAPNAIDFHNESTMLESLNACDGTVSLYARGDYRLPPALSNLPFEMVLPYQVMPKATKILDDYCRSLDAIASTSDLERLYLWRSAVLSLAQTHAHNVAHRDLKTENCLVFEGKHGKLTVQYADFGRGKDLAAPASRPTEMYLSGRGDPFHAPPESLYLQAGPERKDFVAADYYGVGSIFVELLTGLPLTQQTVGNFKDAQDQAEYDFNAGRRRDLSVLTSKHNLILKGISKTVPRSLQDDLYQILRVLCNPDPGKRIGPGPYNRDRRNREPLLWVLDRIDIMIKRLEIEERAKRRQKGKAA